MAETPTTVAVSDEARPAPNTDARSQEWREVLRICQAAFRPQVQRGFPVDVAEINRRGHQERDERIMNAVLGG